MAADSFNVHSATTFARISFIYNINAFNGFLICGFFFSLISPCNQMMTNQMAWSVIVRYAQK